MLQRERVYELIIGDYKTSAGYKITDLQITFEITKSADNSKTPDSAAIEIYNLPQEVLAILDGNYPAAVFSCGYKDAANMARVFSGEIMFHTTRKQGTDKVTQIQMGSGYVELTQNYIADVVPPGGSVEDALESLRKNMPNVSRGVYTGTNIKSKVINGYSLNGNSQRVLNDLARTYQLEWRIDHDILYVTDNGKSVDKDLGSAFILNKDTGLIDIPYYTSGSVGRTKKDKNKRTGLQIRSLLNPAVRPQGIIKLEDNSISGYYRVDTVRHYGDYRGNDWYSDIYCSFNTEEDEVEDAKT